MGQTDVSRCGGGKLQIPVLSAVQFVEASAGLEYLLHRDLFFRWVYFVSDPNSSKRGCGLWVDGETEMQLLVIVTVVKLLTPTSMTLVTLKIIITVSNEINDRLDCVDGSFSGDWRERANTA